MLGPTVRSGPAHVPGPRAATSGRLSGRDLNGGAMLEDDQSVTQTLTLEEKAALCTGANAWETVRFDHAGLREVVMADGPNGVRRVPDAKLVGAPSLPATSFPTASCLASSWDRDLLWEVGQALGRECVQLGVDVLLGPSVNIKRTPVGGRNFEYFSEDPYLTAELAVRYIDGLQSEGVGASLKHFAVNNQEFERLSIDAVVDERTLREIYLPAFEAAVTRSKPWTVMCAYNKLNGAFAAENAWLLTDLLRSEWGFDGLVVSDWGAVHDRVEAVRAGLDLEMPGPRPSRSRALADAVLDGRLPSSLLDASARRVVRLAASVMLEREARGSSEPAAAPALTQDVIDAHHALARRAAAQGMVLLKNDGVLPFEPGRRLAVVGRTARWPRMQGGGSSRVRPTRTDVPLDAIIAAAGGADVTYAPGTRSATTADAGLLEEAVAQARAAGAAVVFASLPGSVESEGYDRPDLELPEAQVRLIQAVVATGTPTVVVLNNGSALVMADWIEGVGAVLQGWLMGQAGGAAVADLLFGVVNPSGKLAETFPVSLQQSAAYINYPGENGTVRYGEGLYVGYRYHDATGVAPAFPFGHGLSYTTFEYTNLRASPETFDDTERVHVSVDVRNSGTLRGREVVQLYVHDQASRLRRPWKELKGFAGVTLDPGDVATVVMTLEPRDFAYFDPAYQRWVSESGTFELLVGASSADIRLRVAVELTSTLELPCVLDRDSTLRDWLADPRGAAVVAPVLDQLFSAFGQAIAPGAEEHGSDGTSARGSDPVAQEDMGMDLRGFLLNMPLTSLLWFQPDPDGPSPDVRVDQLLEAAYRTEP